MTTDINLNLDIELSINSKLGKSQKESLISDLREQLKSVIELKICDLEIKHQKLLDGYNLEIYCDEI